MTGKAKQKKPLKLGGKNKPPGFDKAYCVTAKAKKYWYAWRGGPSIPDPLIDPVGFARAYAAAHENRQQEHDPRSLGDIARAYRNSRENLMLAASTRKIRELRLRAIEAASIGSLPLIALEGRSATAELIKWRDSKAATPRAADEHIETVSILLNWAMLRGWILRNPAARIPAIYKRGAHSAATWAKSDFDAIAKHASLAVRQAIAVAAVTGLRRGDLCDLTWPEVDFARGYIRRATNKSLGHSVAYIPLTPEALAVLQDIGPKAAGNVLNNDQGKPWIPAKLTRAVHDAAQLAGVKLRLHDLRGTYATMLYAAGIGYDEIEEQMGWESGQAKARRRDYANEKTVAAALSDRLKSFAAESQPIETNGKKSADL
jgi:integrase